MSSSHDEPRDDGLESTPAPRRLKSDDLGELTRMRTGLWPRSAAREAEEALHQHAKGDRFILVVDREPGPGLCAFAEATIRPHAEGCATAPVAYLEGIWVDEDNRRGRIAEALIEEIAAWAKRRELRELASDTEVWNEVSKQFHAAVGFDEVGTITCFRRTL